MEIGTTAVVAALVVGIVNLGSPSLVFSQILLLIPGGSMHLLLLPTAATSIVLGISMPVAAAAILAPIDMVAVHIAGAVPVLIPMDRQHLPAAQR